MPKLLQSINTGGITRDLNGDFQNDSLQQLFIISINGNNHPYLKAHSVPPCMRALSTLLNTLHSKIELKKTETVHEFITEEVILPPY